MIVKGVNALEEELQIKEIIEIEGEVKISGDGDYIYIESIHSDLLN